jgi:hypothetical protein
VAASVATSVSWPASAITGMAKLGRKLKGRLLVGHGPHPHQGAQQRPRVRRPTEPSARGPRLWVGTGA